jgi:Skp family chaperone for outer membrane proteins|tara:strand:- start:5410 stop:6732 length:1323 start_codon:yes stop_codon:yes gene_type:complete
MSVIKNLIKTNKSGAGMGELLSAYFQSKNKESKKLRNILVGTLGVNIAENVMQRKVNKNLEDLERQRIFELGGMNAKWEAMQNLIADEKAYRADNNYFRQQAVTKFNEMYPDFKLDTALESEKKEREQEIEDYASALLENHQAKVNTGNFDVKMTKETFFKPFDDHYVDRAREINAPKNKSLVHAGWARLTEGRKAKNPLTPDKIEERRKLAHRGNFGYLLDPDEIKSGDEIRFSRDPSDYVFTDTEARTAILSYNLDRSVKQSLLQNLDVETSYTRKGLQDYVAIQVLDFDETNAKFESAYRSYDNINNITDDNRPAAPVEGEAPSNEYKKYVQRRTVFAIQQTGIGDKEQAEFLSNVYALEDAKARGADDNLINYLQNEISKATETTVDRVIINQIAAMEADPNFKLINADFIEEAGGIEKFYEQFAANLRDTLSKSL